MTLLSDLLGEKGILRIKRWTRLLRLLSTFGSSISTSVLGKYVLQWNFTTSFNVFSHSSKRHEIIFTSAVSSSEGCASMIHVPTLRPINFQQHQMQGMITAQHIWYFSSLVILGQVPPETVCCVKYRWSDLTTCATYSKTLAWKGIWTVLKRL